MKPIRVALPLGIGDAHWSCQKLQGLSQLHGGAPIHAFINESTNHRTVGYLRLIPCIQHAEMSKDAPYCINTQLAKSYRDPRWGTLKGCRAWNGFDYVLVANHAMEQGTHISRWIPECPTHYEFTYSYPDDVLSRAELLMREPTVLLYPSGVGPNQGFHGGWWRPEWWARVVKRLNEAGVSPLFVGADTADDKTYWSLVEKHLGGVFYGSLVGQTSIPDYVLLIERSRAWCGLNSGGGIVAASHRTPTVMLWADQRYKSGGQRFKPAMQTAWLAPDQLSTYRTCSYGDPKLTPERVAEQIIEVMR